MANNSRNCYTTAQGIEYPRTGAILPQPDLGGWHAMNAIGAYSEAIRLGEENPEIYAMDHYRDKSNNAMEFGTRVHDFIDQLISTERIANNDSIIDICLGKWMEWSSLNVKRYIENEKSHISETVGFGGTIDAIAELNDGRTVVLDWKTGKSFYDSYPLQVGGAYVILAKELGIDVSGGICVKLPSAASEPVETRDYSDNAENYCGSFKSLVNAFYRHKKRRLKGNPFVEKYWGK